jgi:hypothetical protein
MLAAAWLIRDQPPPLLKSRSDVMKKSSSWTFVAVGALAIGVQPAQAGSHAGGGVAPNGFSSGGAHKGFETFSNTSTDSSGNPVTSTTRLPSGWDQGKADWKEPLQQSNPTLNTLPPGLSNH